MPFCKVCELQLMQRLEGIRQCQEMNWQWTLRVITQDSPPPTSIDGEIERQQTEDRR